MILTTIGGYTSNGVLRHLDWDVVRSHPKIVMGYSDTTSLLTGLYTAGDLVTFYGGGDGHRDSDAHAAGTGCACLDGQGLKKGAPPVVDDLRGFAPSFRGPEHQPLAGVNRAVSRPRRMLCLQDAYLAGGEFLYQAQGLPNHRFLPGRDLER